jgi:heptosyltransferase I
MSTDTSFPSQRICFVLLSGLGDVVHGLPVVNALKDDEPERHITWVVEPMPGQILTNHPSIDETIVFEPRRGWSGVTELRRRMRGRHFDLTLNLNVYTKSVWPVLLSRAHYRLGFDRRRTHEGVWLASNRHLIPGPRRHTQDQFLEFLDPIGVQRHEPLEWRITFTSEELQARADFFAPLRDRPVAVIVPATGSYKKDWLAERWAAVANALYEDFGYHVVLAGGPGDRETEIATGISKKSSAPIVWAMGDGVRRVAAIVAGADLLLAPDTGPVHIARAFGVPVIGLYGHTNPWRVGPYRAFEDLWIDRYTNPGEEPDPSHAEARWDRMPLITVDDVLSKMEHARNAYAAPVKSP